MEVEHRAVGLQPLAVDGAEHDAAARRKDDVDALDQACERLLLAVAEDRLALDLEDRRNGHAEALFELMIGIDERLAQVAREDAAKCRLAASGHADEEEIAATQQHRRDC